jgi:DNA recombination protein RmuC
MQAVWLAIGVVIGAAIVLIALRGRLRGLGREAARAGELDRALDKARGDLGHERELAQERLANLAEAQARMSESFKALSAEALQTNMAQLAEMAKAQLQTAQAEARGDLDQRRDQVAQLVAPTRVS